MGGQKKRLVNMRLFRVTFFLNIRINAEGASLLYQLDLACLGNVTVISSDFLEGQITT
jgi:hypothetical protein